MELVSEAKVYLLRVVVLLPIAKIPRVLLPAADPEQEAAFEAVAVPLVSLAYVYLFLVVEMVQLILPSANIPTVASGPKAPAPNPYPCADAAPFEKIVGIRYPHLYWV
jgi:hypothetical protein